MTTYYIRASGSNSNAGTSAGAAWATLGKALNSGTPVAAGDVVYVGAGTFRESATITNTVSGSAGSLIQIIGDIDGKNTGDAGEAIISFYPVSDQVAAGAIGLALSTTSFLSFAYLTFTSGASSTLISNTANAHDISFTDCTLLTNGSIGALSWTGPTNGTASNLTFDRCSFLTRATTIALTPSGGNTVDVDHNIIIRNSLIWSLGSSAIAVTNSPSTAKGGGVRIYSCTIIAASSCVSNGSGATTFAGDLPTEIHGCLLASGSTSLSCTALTTGNGMVEDYNWFIASTPRSNVPVGQNSTAASIAPLLEIGQSYKNYGVVRPLLGPSSPSSALLGWGSVASPQTGPFQSGGSPLFWLQQPPHGGRLHALQQAQRFGGPVGPGMSGPARNPPRLRLSNPTSAGLGATVYQTYDWMNRPRPAGGQSSLPAAGYIEYHDSAVKDTVTYDVSPASARLVGPGDLELQVPVDATSTTLSIRCLYDTAYSGSTFPTLSLLANGEAGVTAQTVSAASGSYGTWQTLTLSAFTPTSAGIVRIRLTSYDISGTSQVNFDTFAVA